jgi:PAS domain S-box-containing protein
MVKPPLDFRSMFDALPHGVVIQQTDGKIIHFNPAALTILRLSEDQLLGRTSEDPRWRAIRPDGSEFPGLEHPAMVTLRTRIPQHHVKMGLQFVSGETKWILIHSVPLADTDPFLVMTTFEDITLQFNQELGFKKAQEIAKIGNWRYVIATGEQTWSSEHYRIFEIPEPQESKTLYARYRARIHPDDVSQLDEKMREALAHSKDFVFDHRVVLDRGNRIKYVRGIGQVNHDASGNPVSIDGTCQDLTEQAQSQSQNRFVFEAMGIGIWIFNPVTQDLKWDDSMYRLFEVDPKKFSGHYQAWESTLTPEAKTKAVEELTLALEGKKEFDTTFEIQGASGNHKFIGGRGKVIRNDKGEAMMMYGINWDRTEEVKLERQVAQERTKFIHNAKLASLGELAAGVAHEVNNPLAILLGHASLLRERFGENPANVKLIEAIERSGERIAKIIKGLRTFSRHSDGQRDKTVALRNVIQDALMIADLRANRAGVSLKSTLDENLTLRCDAIEMEQVFVNLIHNGIDAVKSLPEKWVEIRAFQRSDTIVIQVLDSGRGLSPEVREKLFQPFFTTKPVGEGTGLGLSIVKGLVDQHGGNIKVQTLENHTCFELTFPTDASHARPQAA